MTSLLLAHRDYFYLLWALTLVLWRISIGLQLGLLYLKMLERTRLRLHTFRRLLL